MGGWSGSSLSARLAERLAREVQRMPAFGFRYQKISRKNKSLRRKANIHEVYGMYKIYFIDGSRQAQSSQILAIRSVTSAGTLPLP
jgi:hypothetical protein